MEFKKASGRSPKELLAEYIRMGGFPIVALSDFDEGAAYQIVECIYHSVITGDITKQRNISNFDLFNRVVKYVIENVGKTFSANAIVKFLKNERRSLSAESVYNYPKYVVTLDELAAGNINGVKIMHLADFLLSGEY